MVRGCMRHQEVRVPAGSLHFMRSCAPALLLGLLALVVVGAERGSSSAELVDEKAGAAAGAREGRDLAREEREDVGGLTRREQREEKRLERELNLQESDDGRKNHVILSRADRKEDEKENKLVREGSMRREQTVFAD